MDQRVPIMARPSRYRAIDYWLWLSYPPARKVRDMKEFAVQVRGLAVWGFVGLSACSASTPQPSPCPSPTSFDAPSSAVAGPVLAGAAAGSSGVTKPMAGENASTYPPLTIDNTQVRVVHSDLTGKDHQLIFGLPPSFAKEPSRRYPVVYLLDGQWDFSLLYTLSGGLRFDQVMPEVLFVGLSYAGTNPDYDALRSDDYVPTRTTDHEGKLIGGGAAKYLEFIEKVVMPLAENEYRADPNKRVLAGQSYGGLFTLFALFEKPDLFQAYAALSPAAGWDHGYLSKREKEFHKSHPKLERRVWLSIGDSEWPNFVQDARVFFRQFEASHYQGITLKIHTVRGERHAGVKPEAYNRAMRFVTEPWLPIPTNKP